MESVLHLKLFGSPEVWLDEESLTGFITAKSRALLFYLAMKPGFHGRHTLATLLWPETTEPKALKNLRDILSNLRKLAGAHLDITRQTAAFRRDAAYFLDVEEFSALLEQFKRGAGEIGDLETAVSLYKGDFLEGFHLAKTEQYEAWLTSEREQLWQAQKTALNTLAARYAAQADYGRSLDYVSRLLAFDVFCEQGQQLKMALLVQQGQRNDALAQYAAYRRLLNEELGVVPAAAITTLYKQIASGEERDWRLEITSISNLQSPISNLPISQSFQQIDWGDIPGEVAFYGRQEQLKQLLQWLNDGQRRFIAITGMGGVGKTALAARLTRWLAQPPRKYEFIIWRSLINAPPLTVLLRNWLTTLSGQQLAELPETIDEQLSLLLTRLRAQRCLLVLDNFESVMESGSNAGRYRAEYEAYGQLIQRIGGGLHQSCLMITSRELPGTLARLEGNAAQPASMNLPGLPEKPGITMLRAQGLSGSTKKLSALVQRYSGNPLALKLAADTARTLFAGDVEMLLADTAVYGDIRDVLDEQFRRLTPLEDEIITWLAVEREPVSAQTIWDDLARPPHKRLFLEALRSLYFRSLLEHTTESGQADTGSTPRYTLQNVVMEYAAGRFIEAVCREIEAGELNLLPQIALIKAHTKEYVQESQRRLLLEPVAQWLVRRLGTAGAVGQLRFLLKTTQAQPALSPGYAGANILHLLVALGAELDGWDFSHLPIRQADLRRVILRDVSFRGSDLSSAVFRDTFGIVPAVAFSPDGQLLAAASSEGSVTLWRLHEYQPWQVMKRPAGYDLSITFSPDGRYLAGGGSDNVIRLWDVSSGQQMRQLAAHANEITAVLFSPDRKTLVSSSEDQTVGLWDAVGGQFLRQIPTPGNLILTLAVSPDGQILAGGGYDGIVYLWQMDSGVLIRRLGDAPAEKIHAVAFSSDGAWLAAAGEDNEIQLWDVQTGKRYHSLTGHANFVLSVAFHPDGRTLASGSADKTIRLWDWRQGRSERVIHGSANWITSVAFSPDGEILVSGGYDRQIHLWQSRSGHLLHTLQGTLKVVNQVVFSADGHLLASASFDRPVLLWDTHDGRLLHSFQDHSSTVRRLAFSPDGRTLAVSGDENKVRL
ncbi:MAG: NACHT domain-containing protein [Chloroflexi bacterium]|nr:NACHT domain-containing protein [Chloroflexota bacterium]